MAKRAAKAPKKKVDIDDEDSVLEEMSKELDIDVDELSIEAARNYEGFGISPVWEITIKGGRNKEWYVVADDEAADDLAIEVVKQDLESEPEIFNKEFIEQHIDEKKLKAQLYTDVIEHRSEEHTSELQSL